MRSPDARVGAAAVASHNLLSPVVIRRKFRSLQFHARAWLGTGGLPNTLVIGAMKAGTTSLFDYLAQHPDVCPSRSKEPQYFASEFFRGEGWYRAHFRPAPSESVVLEASANTLFHPLAPPRVRRTIPYSKLIVLLRNPVDRAYSHYWQKIEHGFESLSFADALAHESGRLGDAEERMLRGEIAECPNHRHYSYVRRGLYADQIERWLALFPRERFLFLRSEDMFASPRTALDRVLRFLDLEPFAFPDLTPRNARSYPPMDPDVRTELTALFDEPNRRLQSLVGIGWD